jgi:hypothetical protein
MAIGLLSTTPMTAGSFMSEVRQVNWDEVAQAYLDAKDAIYKKYGQRVRLVAFEKYSREEREAIIAGLKAAVTLAVEES